MYDEIIAAVIDKIESGVELYASIDIGSLPANNGISAYIGAGTGDDTVFFDKGALGTLFITVNSKNSSQQAALNALSRIHAYITRLKDYPSGELWSICDISTGTVPNYIGEEDNSQYLYGSILKVKFQIKGVD